MRTKILLPLLAMTVVLSGCSEPGKNENETVRVNKVEIIDKEDLTLAIGDTRTVTAKAMPEEAENRNIIWSSSNAEIAAVGSDTGTVTAVAKGKAVITATSDDNKMLKDSYEVTVVDADIPVARVFFDQDKYSIGVKSTTKLSVTVEPEDATNKRVTWSSSNTGVAQIDSRTGEVKGISVGKTTITATSVYDDNITASCELEVRVIPVETMNFVPDEVDLAVGDYVLLKLEFTPEDATNKEDVVWSGWDEEIVSFENGRVTGIERGVTSVTCTLGDLTATCIVNVYSFSHDMNLLQERYVPDVNFRNWIQRELAGGTDEYTYKQASLYDGDLDVSGLEIASLIGISYFRNVKNLDCSNNNLLALRITKDLQIENLNCSQNSLGLFHIDNEKEMKYIDCSDNNLRNLNLGDAEALISLDCSNNNITTLDIRRCTELTSLDVSGNDIKVMYVWDGFQDSPLYDYVMGLYPEVEFVL